MGKIMPGLIDVIFFDLGDTLVGTNRTFLPGARAVLADLRGRGIRLGVLSNTGDMPRAALTSLLPPDFDWAAFEPALVLLSSEVGLEKPSLEIFKLAVTRATVEAARCLYCSENAVETLVAQLAGMRAARLQKPPHSDLTELIATLTSAGYLN